MANVADPSAALLTASDSDSETDTEESSDSDNEVSESESQSHTESDEEDASDDSKPLSRGEKEVKLVCELNCQFDFLGLYWTDGSQYG